MSISIRAAKAYRKAKEAIYWGMIVFIGVLCANLASSLITAIFGALVRASF